MIALLIQTVTEVAQSPGVMGFFEQYGPLGVGLGLVVALMIGQNKKAQTRIENLENNQAEQYKAHLDGHKAMIQDYVELLKNNSSVLTDLTGCLKAMKDTLERMERKGP